MAEQLRLNLRDPTATDASKRARAQEIAEGLTITDEEWREIFAKKNTDADVRKLRAVQQAVKAGEISRNPAEAFTARGKRKPFTKAEALRLYAVLQEREKERKLRELVAGTPENYRLITTRDIFEKMLAALKREPIIVVDTETTGLDVYDRDEIVGISLTLPRADRHCYIPVAHDEGEQLDREYVLAALKPVLEDESIGKVLHNAKFDIHMFIKHGIRVRGLKWDTQVAMHLLNENEPSFALKNLATKYLDEPSDTYEELFGKRPFNEIPLDVALVYAAKDTDLTWRLYQFQRKHFERLPKLLKIYEEIENPLVGITVDMERTGFVLDVDYAKKLARELRKELAQIHEGLKAHFGDINFNSPIQLKPAIEKAVGHKIDSTDVKTLKQLRGKHEGIELLLQYREKTKLLGTYIEALPKQVKSDGRVHGTFLQAATVTGRFASRDPNLQNQPKYARKLFVPPPGYVLLSGDFSQQEPRLLAHFSEEPVLVNAYREGKDLYSAAASELFGLPIEECGDGSKWRKMMKVGILAVMYGTTAKTLAQQLDITQAEAENFIEEFYRKYPRVKAWIDGNIRFARRHGYVEMLYGRKRRLPQIKSRDKYERFRAERQCTNAIIQGSAAIQTKITMIRLNELCKRKGWQLVLQVHDEIGVYAPETLTREDVEEFRDIMLNSVKLKVPNKTDIEIARRWGEGMTVDEYLIGPDAVKRSDFKAEDEYLKRVEFVRANWKKRKEAV